MTEVSEPVRAAGVGKKKRPAWLEWPLLVGIAGIVLALMVAFVGRPYVIPSASMEPTLHGCPGCTGDRIYVEKLSYDFGDPQPGDVIVFAGPTSSWNREHTATSSGNAVTNGISTFFSYLGLAAPHENDLVKRVIAVGGQTVQCCDAQGRILVNGKPIDDPYAVYKYPYTPGVPFMVHNPGEPVRINPMGREFGPVLVPPGHVWVMGDNRNNSLDSRGHQEDELGGTVPVSNIRGKAVVKIWPLNRIGTVD